MRRGWQVLRISIVLSLALANGRAAEQTNYLEKVVRLDLPKLKSGIPTYYSDGARERAKKLQSAIADMKAFYQKRLGLLPEVSLAVLNSNDWAKVHWLPYGLPSIDGTPPVIFMPATSGGIAFHQMMARKAAIPPDVLRGFLEKNQTTFEAVADDFVDVIGFHELGHELCASYGMDARCNWLNEFAASYFAYAFIAERRPASRRVFDLLGRPSHARPKNTTLADFERLYVEVDDYGWYQGLFETRIRELYPRAGWQFLKALRNEFPPTDGAIKQPPVAKADAIPPEEVLERVEKIAPGFQAWAKVFEE
jgi:hypothetical protein